MKKKEINENLLSFTDFLKSEGIYYWEYDLNGDVICTNCPHTVFSKIFLAFFPITKLKEYNVDYRFPIMVHGKLGIMWCVDYELCDTGVKSIHVLGPIAAREVITPSYQTIITEYDPNFPSHWYHKFAFALSKIPVPLMYTFYTQVTQFHYYLQNKKIQISDIRSQKTSLKNEYPLHANQDDFIEYYRIEQAALQNLISGNLDFEKDYSKFEQINKSTRFMKTKDDTAVQVFFALCVRAAIAGGVSPDVAFSKSYQYGNLLENCSDQPEIRKLQKDMYEEMLLLVHQSKKAQNLSSVVEHCLDYISLHVEDELSISVLAKRFGYVEYYLSKKFKEETGITINDCIKNSRIERSKVYLSTTRLPIQEIADTLHFGSRSFFVRTFKETTGETPSEYRKANYKQ